ncbi:MAG: TonB-dependent receptor [Burkholderiales bacterium]|nr:TonB-dependent receptor [Burkholderiales bacterium]
MPSRLIGAVALLVLPHQEVFGAEVEAPEVEVIGHYETGIGTSDAASEGSVTHKRIETRPLLRPGELVELVPGMIVTQHSGGGKANQYFLRGYNLDHGTDFALTVDGMPVNMPTHGHGQGYADINFLIPELVSGVDFRKGPYFASEGDFSTAGAAHIHLFEEMPRSLGMLTAGTDGYGRIVAAASPKAGAGRLLLGFEALTYDGPWVNEEDLRKFNGVLRYSQGDAANGFNVTLMGYDSDWTATDQIPERAVASGEIDRFGTLDPSDGGETSRFSLSGNVRHALGNGQAQLDAYIIRYALDLWSNFTYALDDPLAGAPNGDQFKQADRRTVYGLHPRYAWSGKLGSAEATNTVGAQVRYDDIRRVGLYSTTDRNLLSTTREDGVNQLSGGIYFENATQWTPWLRSIAGLRADWFRFDVDSSIAANSGKESDSIVSPKLGLVFGPWARTEYFVNAGYGFHSNDARGTTIAVDPKTLDPADPVDPLVRTKGAEFGVRTQLVPKLQSSLSLWYLEQESELLFVGDAGTTEASRPSRRGGVEWINYYRPLPWLLVDAELAVARARFRDDDPAGKRIPGALERMAQIGITVEDLGRWFGSVQMRYLGSRPLIEDNSVRSDSTTITNARVGYRLTKSLRLQLDVLNLFGSKDQDIAYFYASCLPSELGSAPCPAAAPRDGVEDVHFHPVEPRQFRLTLVGTF